MPEYPVDYITPNCSSHLWDFDWARGNYVYFTRMEEKGGRIWPKLWWMGQVGGRPHAGDTEETDKTSVLEVLESSELSSTFFPKSCKMQFRN